MILLTDGAGPRDFHLAAELVNGHVIITLDGREYLIDTGSPVSLQFDGNLAALAGSTGHHAPEELRRSELCHMAERIREGIHEHVSSTIAGLSGMDILGKYDCIFSAHDRSLQLRQALVSPIGSIVLPVQCRLGVPIIGPVVINGTLKHAIWDTGAQISYVLDSQLINGCDALGPREDFHPLSTPSRFTVEAFKLPLAAGQQCDEVTIAAATLPPFVNSFGWDIIGSEIIQHFDVHLSIRQKFFALRRRHGYGTGARVHTSAQPSVLSQLPGRSIKDVVIKRNGKGSPRSQCFLIFNDDTHVEFYADEDIHITTGLDAGGVEDVLRYIHDFER